MMFEHERSVQAAGPQPVTRAGEKVSTARVVWSIGFLCAIWLATQISAMFTPGLLDDMDGLHVEAVREMVQRHDYVTLYVDGIRYLDKPPLPYWMGTLSVHLFGMHDWAIRLPLVLSVLALSLFLYRFGWELFGERAGFFAACAFSTCLGPFIFTRFFIPDVMLSLWITVAIYLVYRMVSRCDAGGKATLAEACGFALMITCAVLTKGLIGVVFPVGILFAFLLFTGRLRYVFSLRPGTAAVVTVLTAAPWHIFAAIQNKASGDSKGWFWFYFINDQLNRYLNKRIPRDYDKVPFFIFWGLLLVWLFPWGVYLLGVLRQWWRQRPAQKGRDRLLLVIWGLFVLIFFSFSTRQEYYTLPAVPAMCLLIGDYLAEESVRPELQSIGRLWSGILLAISAAVGVVCLGLAITAVPQPGRALYEVLGSDPSHYALSFGHIFDLTTRSMSFFRGPLVLTGVSMLGGAAISFWLKLRGRYVAGNVAWAAGMIGVLIAVHTAFVTFNPILGSQGLADAINSQWRTGDELVFDGQYSLYSSVGFYTGHPVQILNGRVNNLWYGSQYADAPNRWEDENSFAALWQSDRRVFLVTNDQARIARLGASGRLLATAGGKAVLVNHP